MLGICLVPSHLHMLSVDLDDNSLRSKQCSIICSSVVSVQNEPVNKDYLKIDLHVILRKRCKHIKLFSSCNAKKIFFSLNYELIGYALSTGH